MTDYIYKLPVKLVSKNGRKYSEQIFKSIRKQLKSKKLIGTVGEMTFEETTDLIKNKQSLFIMLNDYFHIKKWMTTIILFLQLILNYQRIIVNIVSLRQCTF